LKQYKEDILEILKDYLGNNNVNRYKVKNIGYWLTISDEVTESGEREYITEEISENDCLEFSVNESYTDGLGRLVSHYYKNNCENLKKEQDLASVSMFVEINLPLAQDANDKFNMNVVKMVGLLKTLTYDLNIMERGDCADDVYPSIIFFPELNSFDTYLRTIKNENGILNSYRAETLRTRE
jgi:hypothetical protein